MLEWDNKLRIKRFPPKSFIHSVNQDKKGTIPQSVKFHQNRTTMLASVCRPRSNKTLNLKIHSKSVNEPNQPLPVLMSKDFTPLRTSRYSKPAIYKRLVPIVKKRHSSINRHRTSRGSVPVTWNEKCMTIKKASIYNTPQVKQTPHSMTLDQSLNQKYVHKKTSYEYRTDRVSIFSLDSFPSSESFESLYNLYNYTMPPKIT